MRQAKWIGLCTLILMLATMTAVPVNAHTPPFLWNPHPYVDGCMVWRSFIEGYVPPPNVPVTELPQDSPCIRVFEKSHGVFRFGIYDYNTYTEYEQALRDMKVAAFLESWVGQGYRLPYRWGFPH
jgi:hypothetical protein